jgi:hypothetical protein
MLFSELSKNYGFTVPELEQVCSLMSLKVQGQAAQKKISAEHYPGLKKIIDSYEEASQKDFKGTIVDYAKNLKMHMDAVASQQSTHVPSEETKDISLPSFEEVLTAQSQRQGYEQRAAQELELLHQTAKAKALEWTVQETVLAEAYKTDPTVVNASIVQQIQAAAQKARLAGAIDEARLSQSIQEIEERIEARPNFTDALLGGQKDCRPPQSPSNPVRPSRGFLKGTTS